MTRRVLLVVAALAAASCIERPGEDARTAEDTDRSTLSDVLFTEPAAGLVPVEANFDDVIELVGVEFSPARPKAGDTVTVSAWFKATETVRDDWKIFVHVDVDGGKTPKLNVDHFPAGGRYRTGAWRQNDVVKDTFKFVVPTEGKRLGVWLGFYLAEERLTLLSPGRASTDGANRVRALTIAVD